MTVLKRALCCLLVLVMVLGLAACDTAKPGETNKPGENQPAEREHVELVVYNYISNSSLPGWDETVKAVNEYLKEKLNTTLEMHVVEQGDYTGFAGPAVTGGTGVDMVFTRTGNLPFLTYAGMNAFLPLEDYIDEQLPLSKALLPEASWDAVTVDGHVYAVPVERDAATRYNLHVNTTLAEDIGVTIPETFNTFLDLYDFFREAKEKRDAKYPEKASQPILNMPYQSWMAWCNSEAILQSGDWILAANVPGLDGVKSAAADGSEVYCPYLTEEFKEIVKIQTQMAKDGIFPYDPDNFDPDSVMRNTGELIAWTGTGSVYVDEDSNMPYFKTGMIVQDHAVLTTTGYQHGFAVTRPDNLERCLEVIELLNTDTYLATTFRFGPEGVGWTDTNNDGQIEVEGTLNADTTNRYWYYWYGWNLGGLTVSKVPPDYPLNFTELLADLNGNAVPSGNLGFILNQDPISDEIAAVVNVISEYFKPLTYGQYENPDSYIEEFVQKLKDNGIEKIIAEAQSQLDAWREANK